MDEEEQAQDHVFSADKCRICVRYPRCLESGLATIDDCVQELSYEQLLDGLHAMIEEEIVEAEMELRL